MPKSRVGGRRQLTGVVQAPQPVPQASTQAPPQPTPPPQPVPQVTQPTIADIIAGNVMPKGGVPFAQFESMTDDQKAQVIIDAIGQTTPIFLDSSDAQKLAYFTGLSDKPTLVSEAQLQAMKGRSLWRSVHDVYNKQTDISYTGAEIYQQVATGDFTMYSDSGGSAYGKAIYFDVTKGSYGSGSGYTIMHAKFLPTANVGDYYTVYSQASAEMRKGTKLGNALSRVDSNSRVSVYALAKGYDALQDGANGYRMILNRRCLALSTTTF